MHRSSPKSFIVTVVLHLFVLVSCKFLAETDLFLRMIQINVDVSIRHLITTYPLLPSLWLHLCTPPSRLYCYDQYLLIVAAFDVVCNFPCTDYLLLLYGLISDNVDNVFNHYVVCIIVP